jgi:uncharacterized membrane protein
MRSADRSGIRWLLAELPQLVVKGLLTGEATEKLRAHYLADAPGDRRNFGFLLSATLGSLLVGGGVVLLVAHNWDFLSRPVRCGVAFAPVVCSQALAIFVLLRRNESIPVARSCRDFKYCRDRDGDRAR